MHCAHLTVHSFIGFGTHNGLLFPAIPVPFQPHISWDTLLGLTIKAKYSKTVIGPFGFQFIGKGSDSGYIVPHISIPPLPFNYLLPVIIAFGSSKPMFSASKVLINVDGEGLPLTAAIFGPTSLNQACNDPCNYPSDFVIAPNTVIVGLSILDIFSGLFSIVLDSAISFIAGKIGGDVAEGLLKHIGGPIVTFFIRDFTESLTRLVGRETAELWTREAAENILERPLAKVVEEVLGKIIGNEVGNVIADSPAPPGQNGAEGEANSSISGQGSTVSSSSTTTVTGYTENSSSAPPIFEAI